MDWWISSSTGIRPERDHIIHIFPERREDFGGSLMAFPLNYSCLVFRKTWEKKSLPGTYLKMQSLPKVWHILGNFKGFGWFQGSQISFKLNSLVRGKKKRKNFFHRYVLPPSISSKLGMDKRGISWVWGFPELFLLTLRRLGSLSWKIKEVKVGKTGREKGNDTRSKSRSLSTFSTLAPGPGGADARTWVNPGRSS